MGRIILDCDLMKFRNSGLYHYCLNLGNYVKAILDLEGQHEMRYYVPPSEADAFDHPEAAIRERKWHSRYFQPFLGKCDVWHAPFQTGRIIPHHQKHIKVLLTIHDLNVLHEDKPDTEKRDSLNKTQKLINRSDAVVCISQHTRKDVMENLDTGNKPVFVIHNGTHKVNGVAVHTRGFRPAGPFIFTLGYVNRKKNFHTLLGLVQNQNMELVIAGRLDEPDYVEGIKKQAAALGISDKVHVLGPVAESDKSWYFENCLAFVMPSLAEGFGAPVVEAMSFGKPIFLSARTSLPEIGGDVSFYFDDFTPAHMQRVFCEGMEKYQREEMRERIRQRGQSFNWAEKAREYIKVYSMLMEIK